MRQPTVETLVLWVVLAWVLLRVRLLVFRSRRRSRHSLLYRWYMRSRLWRIRRWWWYVTSDRRCEDCGRRMVLHRRGLRYRLGTPVMTVHHKTYKHLARERRREIQLLCWRCHSGKDAYRFRALAGRYR